MSEVKPAKKAPSKKRAKKPAKPEGEAPAKRVARPRKAVRPKAAAKKAVRAKETKVEAVPKEAVRRVPRARAKKVVAKPRAKAAPIAGKEELPPEAPKPAPKTKAARGEPKSAGIKQAAVTVVEVVPPKAPPREEIAAKPAPKAKKAAVPKAVKAAKPKPARLGIQAVPTVMVFYKGDMKEREAKGFSFAELREAGVTKDVALISGLRVDSRRRSVRARNVKLLQAVKPKAA